MNNLSQDNMKDVLNRLKSMRPDKLTRFQEQALKISKQFYSINRNPLLRNELRRNSKPENKWIHELQSMTNIPAYNQLRAINKRLNKLNSYQFINFMNTGFINALQSTESKYPNIINEINSHKTVHKINKYNSQYIKKHSIKALKQNNNKHENIEEYSVNDIIQNNYNIKTDVIRYIFFEILVDIIGSITIDEFNYLAKMLIKALNQL